MNTADLTPLLDRLRAEPRESEWLEFKANRYEPRAIGEYQHCCLMYVTNQRMSNQSLRLRFGLGEDKTVVTSQVIGAAKEAGLIKADESETTSTRYARYLPFWA